MIAAFQIITAAGIIVFWLAFFSGAIIPEDAPGYYLAYEYAFPVADALLAAGLFCSALLILKRNPLGRDLALVCAGALIFLGILDISFNTLNGIYALSTMDALTNGFVNLYCIVFGIIMILTQKGNLHQGNTAAGH
ncbi:MAG TPA: hypothetical protein ENN34_01360 [Deltaproteobacteria bacterium]|nr:hypothetical protein [Deltaproteobacteria bacterium]